MWRVEVGLKKDSPIDCSKMRADLFEEYHVK